ESAKITHESSEIGAATARSADAQEFVAKTSADIEELARKYGEEPPSSETVAKLYGSVRAQLEGGIPNKEVGSNHYRGFWEIPNNSVRYEIIGMALRDVAPFSNAARKIGAGGQAELMKRGLYGIGTGVDRAALRSEVGMARMLDPFGDAF